MRIHGIGIDVVEIPRIAVAIEKHGESFLARIFTEAERAYCAAHGVPDQHYAARFAAKEAVAKALGTGIGEHASWLDLEVGRTATGAPTVILHGAAAAYAERHGITSVQLSLTHTKAYAAANAIAVAE